MDSELVSQAGAVLFFTGLTWVGTSAVSGFFVRSLEPFGHHARLAWWGVIHLVISNTAPAVAVVNGANFFQAGIVLMVTSVICYIPVYIDMFRLMKREKIVLVKPSWTIGFNNFLKSTGVTGKLILENLRQQGVRLVLAPISGAAALAAFSTMRTGANVALQGMNSIINPLMPDLMRFLHERDQERSEAGFSTIWIVVVALLSPAVIVLQAIAAPLFDLWTHGRIQFEPTLFSMLSLSVLAFAIAQPAVAVVMGNNIIRPQLILSGLSAIVVIALVALLVPTLGLLGAGIAIVVAEIAAAIGYVITAKTWLSANDLRWPTRSFRRAVMAVVVSATSMVCISLFPQYSWMICVAGVLLCGLNSVSYWFTLPPFVREKVHIIIRSALSRVRSMVAQSRS